MKGYAKRISELPSLKKGFLWLPKEERKCAEVLQQLGVLNNLNISFYILLGSKVGERANTPEIFLTIGERLGINGLSTVTLQMSATKVIEGDVQPTTFSSEV